MNLDSSKAYQDSDISTKVFKSNSDVFADALYSEFNRSLESKVFPPSIKLINLLIAKLNVHGFDNTAVDVRFMII